MNYRRVVRRTSGIESKPREIKIWTALQIALTILSLITLRHMSLRPAPATPGYSPIGADLVLGFLFYVLVVGFILGIALSFGLWAGKGWARNWGTVYSISSLLYGLFWTYITASSRLSGDTTPFIDGLLIIGILYVLVSLPNLYFVTRSRVQDFFKHEVHVEEEAQKGIYVEQDERTPEELALLAEYQRRYPHNPEGVLEFHISTTMKDGKTREQAVKELAKESE